MSFPVAKTYFTDKPCKHGHLAERYVASRQCVVCHAESQKRRRATAEGKAAHLARVKEWQVRNPEKVKAYKTKYVNENREQIYNRLAACRKANPERRKAILRAYAARNKDKLGAATRNRQAKKLAAMPSWVDKEALRIVYEQCAYITRLTAEPHEVDHIVPLQHSAVCGLHVPWNLQIIPTIENRRKANFFQGTR